MNNNENDDVEENDERVPIFIILIKKINILFEFKPGGNENKF